MSIRRKAELYLFTLAAAAHLALGWHFRTVDYEFFRRNLGSPWATIAVAAVFSLTALMTRTKRRMQAILYAKVIAILYLILLWESLGEFDELLQIFPPLFVLWIRNEIFNESESGLGGG